jgi:hypothetical protein
MSYTEISVIESVEPQSVPKSTTRAVFAVVGIAAWFYHSKAVGLTGIPGRHRRRSPFIPYTCHGVAHETQSSGRRPAHHHVRHHRCTRLLPTSLGNPRSKRSANARSDASFPPSANLPSLNRITTSGRHDLALSRGALSFRHLWNRK